MIGVGWRFMVALGGTHAGFVSRWPIALWINQTHREEVWQARESATPAQIRAWLDTGPRGT